jgi:uncharacterized protein
MGPTVANSSCLIALEGAGHLELLQQLYGTILVPEAVFNECGRQVSPWIVVRPVQNRAHALALQVELGPGEAEAIVLSSETSAARIILDDKKARRIARQHANSHCRSLAPWPFCSGPRSATSSPP